MPLGFPQLGSDSRLYLGLLVRIGRSNLKRVYNELGGKSAFIVFPDFEDLQRAATTVAGSMFFNQGESCNAPSRVFVHESVAERFVEIVAAEAPKYMPGDPLSGSAGMVRSAEAFSLAARHRWTGGP